MVPRPAIRRPTVVADDLRDLTSPIDLVRAAHMALQCAKQASRAQAKLLDIADVDTPQLARDIGPAERPRNTVRDVHISR